MLKGFGVPALVALCCACGVAGVAPLVPSDTRGLATAGSSTQAAASSKSPKWIFSPAELPPGRIGKNNCTFAFALGGDPNFHPQNEADPLRGSCWERAAGHGGFFRQQFQAVHVAAAPACGGGPGDLKGIRVCRHGGAGQQTPCGKTGPNGCALCTPDPITCH
jgi:hypothetical protein